MTEPPPPPGRLLLVFAKAPVAGRVKTRLASDVGPEAAARVYRALGRRVVRSVSGGAFRTVVCCFPPGSEARCRDWLGEGPWELRSQRGHDLGARMEAAFADAFREADRVCVVGTDVPGLGAAHVERAFDALDGGADAVFGPAVDGGYYLLALDRPAPGLFRDMTWSTDRVLADSLARARGLGLVVDTLEPLRDVDTLDDLQALGAYKAGGLGPIP